MTFARGDVVLVEGSTWNVIAARHGVVWLTTDAPWRALRVVCACRCARVIGAFASCGPWEIN